VTFLNDAYVGFEYKVPLCFEIENDPSPAAIDEYDIETLEAARAPSFLKSIATSFKFRSADKDEDSSEGEPEEHLEEMLREKLK
jgi:hypothetical protein